MRLNQYVASASDLSRRAADLAITAGRITVNGRRGQLGDAVTQDDAIKLDGSSLKPPTTHTYIMLNKPVGYVSSRTKQGSDPILYELLPDPFRRLRIVGRLDLQSSGLVLLSDDGDFVNHFTHPSFNKRKLYEITLTQNWTETATAALAAGVKLKDGLSRVELLKASGRRITVAISEGRNRQLRRTFGALGYEVERLHRVQVGPYKLGSLSTGQWQPIEIKP